MRYRIYGMVFESDLVFPQLMEETTACKADFCIRVSAFPEKVKEHIRENRGPSGRGEDFYWFNSPGGYFVILRDKEILLEQRDREKQDKMKTYLLGYGISMLLYAGKRMAVHCSAVAKDGSCILLSGHSGAGKSTLAGKLLEHSWKLVADDVAAVWRRQDSLITAPAFPMRKLCRNAAIRSGYETSELLYIDEDKDKFAVFCPEQFEEGESQVRAMFVITPYDGEEVRLEELSGQDKIQTFLNNLFLHVIIQKEGMEPEKFFAMLEMLSLLPVYKLYRPLRAGDTSEEMARLCESIPEILQLHG